MKHALAFIAALLAALCFALVGAWVLHSYHSTSGLLIGLTLVLIGIAIAAPMQFHNGVVALKENILIIVPVIVGAIVDGKRSTDPQSRPPTDPPAGPSGGVP